jgi:hypothetical protein
MLGFTVLWISVGAGHPKNHPMSGEECSRGGIVKLMTVVTLNSFDGGPNCVETKAIFFDKVKKLSDLTRKGKVHIKGERSSIMSR